jgi:hypothetical protein
MMLRYPSTCFQTHSLFYGDRTRYTPSCLLEFLNVNIVTNWWIDTWFALEILFIELDKPQLQVIISFSPIYIFHFSLQFTMSIESFHYPLLGNGPKSLSTFRTHFVASWLPCQDWPLMATNFQLINNCQLHWRPFLNPVMGYTGNTSSKGSFIAVC